jgi:predicted metal-dependent HD superfamily phosphohydrolase
MNGPISILEGEWLKDTARFSSAVTGPILQNLLTRHAEPHRRYHGPEHLVSLFDLLSRHAPHIEPGSIPRLAVWWHDAIYDPTRKDNEDESANLAVRHLCRFALHSALLDQVCDLIAATKNHWDARPMGDGDYFLDADIAILGAPAGVYDRYAANVRIEYAWVPEAGYQAGRTAFLTSALVRPRLFRTEVFQDTYAKQARANMHRELASLTRAP